jgi:Bifunctional DNA primase/polymerase, N-terminal
MRRRSSREALRAAALGYASSGVPILPDQLVHHPPQASGSDPPICCCRRRDCPALPLHPPRRLDQDPNPRLPVQVEQWWAATPDAAIATVAGAAFDVIEMHTAIPPDVILTWLADQGLAPVPTIYAGLGRLQLLAAPDSYQADRYDAAAAAILYLPPGALVLLPPSRMDDGQSVRWQRPLNRSVNLPDGRELFFALFDLPATRQLADPDIYRFAALHPRSRQAGLAR